MALSTAERQERLVSGLVYELWGTDPDRPDVKIPGLLFEDGNWDSFQAAVINRAGSEDEEDVAEVLAGLDGEIGDEIWWLIGEDDEVDEPPPESLAMWFIDKL